MLARVRLPMEPTEYSLEIGLTSLVLVSGNFLEPRTSLLW